VSISICAAGVWMFLAPRDFLLAAAQSVFYDVPDSQCERGSWPTPQTISFKMKSFGGTLNNVQSVQRTGKEVKEENEQ
jgi:hypothetical protein